MEPTEKKSPKRAGYKNFLVNLDDETLRKFDQLCWDEGRTRNGMICRLITLALKGSK